MSGVTDEQLAECTDDEPTVSDEQLATWHRWGAQARVFGDSPEEKRLGHAVVALAAEVRRLRAEAFRYRHMAIIATQLLVEEERSGPDWGGLRTRYWDRIEAFFEAEREALSEGEGESMKGWRR